ncbi:tyrosine-type recombinase/integrase [Aquirhabdus sp.]|uniref:tyrosine-type recombinase/integrase n=1 Tax=Aquirhabdus sp. TaxID=2824160 RepID=UPI00396C7631
MLTDAFLRKVELPPLGQKAPVKHSDGKGLQLHVFANGGKYWRMAYRFEGKQKTYSIGIYPEVTLKEARLKCDEARKLIQQGIDPTASKHEAKNVDSGKSTFRTLALAWMDDRRDVIKPVTMTRDLSTFEKDLFPEIGDMPIDTIKGKDVLAAAKKIEARGALEMAKRSIPLAGAIFRYAIRQGLIENDPTPHLAEALKSRKVKHMARIDAKDLPKLLADINSYTGDVLVVAALNLMCLTFVRTVEMRFMEWTEVDFEKKEWRIPAEKMKMQAQHIVPLSTQAIAVLKSLVPLTGKRQYVFFNQSSYKPLSENAVLSALWRMGYKGRMTGHGFRGLASTTLHEQGYMHDAIEIQLAHTVGSAVSSAYNHAQHLDYRRKMMQEWAEYLDSLRT